MNFLYNISQSAFQLSFPILKLTSPKMELFVQGRENWRDQLKGVDFHSDTWYWFHCASLGEYEQAVPLIESIRNKGVKILVSFFSPSGYEQKKKHKLIDVACYLPIDTPKNAKDFVGIVKPAKAFFVKYEFWENYFSQLRQYQIPLYMVSSTFRQDQVYFQWYGGFFKKTLEKVTHFFVQNQDSLEVITANGFKNASLSGDTRFDRVYAQLSMDNKLDFIEDFIGNRLCAVFGSSWPDCEDAFIDTINNEPENVCFIIAPHEIKAEKIAQLKTKLKVETSVFSKGVVNTDRVLIVDAIGYLTRIYSYANIAYVGGAMGTTGLHNILEPATFGVPILVGPNHEKFPEAKALESYGGLKTVRGAEEFNLAFTKLVVDTEYREKQAKASESFVQTQVGATKVVLDFIGGE